MTTTTAVAQRGQIEELELSRPIKVTFSADFYGAIFGTAAAIALMVITFIFAPLFVGITLLVIGIVSIVLAAIAVTVKHLVLQNNTTFLRITEGSKKDLITFESQTNRSIKMTDGTTLKGFFYSNPENQNKEIKDQKLAIYFPGNAEEVGCHMSTQAFKRDLRNDAIGIFADHSMYSFAYRGTNESTGRTCSIKQNASDGFEVIKAAVAEGYDINNITLHGVSFGGSVAPLVKQLCLENNIGNPALLVLHTFHTLDTFISGTIKDPVGKAFVEGISKFFFFISEYSHRLTAENWNKLGTRNFCIGGGAFDRVINPDMCLAAKLLKEDPKRKDTFMRKRNHNDLPIRNITNLSKVREILELPPLKESIIFDNAKQLFEQLVRSYKDYQTEKEKLKVERNPILIFDSLIKLPKVKNTYIKLRKDVFTLVKENPILLNKRSSSRDLFEAVYSYKNAKIDGKEIMKYKSELKISLKNLTSQEVLETA